ncbi:MAG TPA: antitoxin [Methylomirabilota bacterium]|nr:antitoxin [Methylomirabilota bacterium]
MWPRSRAAARHQGISFKQALNQAVRARLGPPRRSARRFTQLTQAMSLRPDVNLDKARLATALEDEELVRKVDLRK